MQLYAARRATVTNPMAAMAVWKSLIFGLALMVAGEECDGNQLLQTQRRAVERLPGLAPGKSALIVVAAWWQFISLVNWAVRTCRMISSPVPCP